MLPTPLTRDGSQSRRAAALAGRQAARALAFVAVVTVAVGCRKGSSQEATPSGGKEDAILVNAPHVIVVLGSSTAAGVGPKDPEHAWVPRYARYLAETFPGFGVQSLAVGGQTTYHIQPTGYVPPPGRPAPSVRHNVTAALALAPYALIVNMPSNDTAEHYSLAEQLANFDRVRAVAEAARVPLWVTTTQPRNFEDARQLAAHAEVRRAILQRFAPRTLDFWTPVATPTQKLAPRFDAGDGTHLNAAGHALLLERVVAAAIPQAAPPAPP